MKVAIHNVRSGHWWHEWVNYCQAHGVDYELVNCYQPDIIRRLRAFDVLLWNFNHAVPADVLMARHVLYSAAEMGLRVFPDFSTSWHFDDKVAQTYLLQAVGAPVVPSWTFYDKPEAIAWLRDAAEFPLVAKLRRGAGSYNVRLLRGFRDASAYTSRMFGRGYPASPRYLQDAANHFRRGANWSGRWARVKKLPSHVRKVWHARGLPPERGYVYFQKFIPDNAYDIRVSVIGNRAWGFIRYVRENDFRASGSGRVDYDVTKIPAGAVRTAFEVVGRLKAQSLCFDYVRSSDATLHIVEISYGFVGDAVQRCPGHWDPQLVWHEGHVRPEHAILDDLLGHSHAGPAEGAH